jgi:hypothetical protein
MILKPCKGFIFLMGLILLAGSSAADQVTPVQRTVLVLYDSAEPSVTRLTERVAGLYLNYLGMKVRYHDIHNGLPDDKSLNDDVRGILTVFVDDEMERPVEYCRWLERQIKDGIKVIILGHFGALSDRVTKELTPIEEVNRPFRALGLEYEGNWTDNPLVIRIADKDSAMVEFERSLEGEAGQYEGIKSINRNNRVYLTLERTDLADSASAAVVTTPFGGVVQPGYGVFLEFIKNRIRWRINPFRFYEEAFGLKDLPRFDTTTAMGRRIFYTHIDGDGIRNMSKIDPLKYSGEIIYEEILKKYTIPFTASFISSDVLPQYYGNEKLLKLVGQIAALPNVEIGVHGFTHPLDWNKMVTATAIKGYSRSLGSSPEDVESESVYGFGAKVTVSREEYLKREITGAASDINGILPLGKKVVINQWTGNCSPPEAAVKLTRELGLKNINGGDSRLDEANPSYTNLAPLDRPLGDYHQIYASNANENIYTNLWTGPYGAYEKVIETFKETEVPKFLDSVPRRVSPVNVYYHFYSGEQPEALKALKNVYEYVLHEEVIPLYTSEYAGIAEDFFKGQMSATGDGGWIFSNYSSSRTVRFDLTDNRMPDLERSQQIIGFSRWKDHLYVTLNNAGKAVVYLTDQLPSVSYLLSASAPVQDWTASDGKIEFTTRVVGEAVWTIGGVQKNRGYSIRLADIQNGREIKTMTVTSDSDGILEIKLRENGKFKISAESAA